MESNSDSCDKNVTIAEDNGVSVLNLRVLNIPEIRRHILSFLPFDCIKNCRLVCREWNATGERLLLERSIIMFRNNRKSPKKARLPDRFIDDFRDNFLFNKIDKFCFRSPDYPFDFEDIEDFIENFGSNIKELTFFRSNFRWLQNKPDRRLLMKLIPLNLMRLDVFCANVRTKLVIPMDRLKNIHTLRVVETILKPVKDAESAPVELSLTSPFFLENRMYKIVTINHLFDFHNLQILKLDCKDTQNMELDMVGEINLKLLILKRIKVINWGSSNWTTRKLVLGEKMKFDTATGMKFDNLEYGGEIIDILVLPHSLKVLTLRTLNAEILNIKLAHHLSDLQCLILQPKTFFILNYFRNCTKLTNLHLIGNDSSPIDIDFIPKSVKVLRLTGKDCKLFGYRRFTTFRLDTIMVENMSYKKSFNIVGDILRVKSVYMDSSGFELSVKDGVIGFMNRLFDNYTVGPFFEKAEDEFVFNFFADAKRVGFLIKNSGEDATTKTVDHMEGYRIKFDWWANNLPKKSFIIRL